MTAPGFCSHSLERSHARHDCSAEANTLCGSVIICLSVCLFVCMFVCLCIQEVHCLLLEIVADYQLVDNRTISLFTHVISVSALLTYLLARCDLLYVQSMRVLPIVLRVELIISVSSILNTCRTHLKPSSLIIFSNHSVGSLRVGIAADHCKYLCTST